MKNYADKGTAAVLLSFGLINTSCAGTGEKSSFLPDRPNIFLIVADDLGWSDLSCYGNTFNETPVIDRLAAEGMRFTHAYAACPVSSPTRASILTGKYPVRTGITDWLPGRQKNGPLPGDLLRSPALPQNLDLNEITLAERLKPFGYSTALIGKWHLGDSLHSPLHQGFDKMTGGRGSAQHYFYPDWLNHFNTRNISGKPGEYIIDRLTDESLQFIRQNSNHPFFLYLGLYTVHIPLQAPDSLIKKYKNKKTVDGDPYLHNPVYAAMLENTDHNIGRILALIDSLGIAKNTLVIFTSDNGGLSVPEGPMTPASNNYPLRAGKGYLYEGGIRVPLIIRWPGQVTAGTITDAVTISPDHFATIGKITGADYSHTDGMSYLDVLLNRRGYDRGPIYFHYPHYSNQGGKPASAVIYKNYKLIFYYEDNHKELYNLADDPTEKNDQALLMKSKVAELSVILDQWLKSVNAKKPEPVSP